MEPLFWAFPVLSILVVYSVWISFYCLLNVLWDPGYLECADLRFLQTLDSMHCSHPGEAQGKPHIPLQIFSFRHEPTRLCLVFRWISSELSKFASLFSSLFSILPSFFFPPLYFLASMIFSSPYLLLTLLTLIKSLCWYKDNLGNGKMWTWLCLKLCSQSHRDVTVS